MLPLARRRPALAGARRPAHVAAGCFAGGGWRGRWWGSQPYTPVTQTVRGQLTGTHIGSHVIAAIAWSLGIAIVSYVWAVRLYNRRRAADPK
jgi:hypothetical protein